MNHFFEEGIAKINTLGRAKYSCLVVFEHLKKLPQVLVSMLADELNMTAPTARSSLTHLVKLGVVDEISGQKRDKMYIYREYLNILEEGAEPFEV